MSNSVSTLLKPKWRWMQFSLRTAFLVVTAICVALTYWVIPAEKQRRAVAAIEAVGGHAEYFEPQANRLTFVEPILRRWLPASYFDGVQMVGLYGRGNDTLLAHLESLTGLEVLDLDHSNVTDIGLAHLQGQTGLKELYLSETAITDAALTRLQPLKHLQVLNLGQTLITDSGLSDLRGLSDLQYLDLSGTQVTDEGLVNLQGLKALEMLSLDGSQVTNASVIRLRQALPNCEIVWP
jgi:hypothetical protein